MAIVEVVKYNGAPDVFAWKYPSEELGTWTQLIVAESQQAILFKEGKALDVFSSGRHTLDTLNIPLLNNLINLPFGGRSPFTAEVWYVNMAHNLDVKWGTATPIQLQDPKYNIFIPVRAHGQFGLKIEDAKTFVVKLVGTLPQFSKDSLVAYFRGLYLTKVKDAISNYLVHKQISILEINSYLNELSAELADDMKPALAEYGISLVNFYVNDISVPENDEAVMKLKNALAKRAEMDIIGYSYQQERSFDTLEGAANNKGAVASGIMNAGLGLAMGTAIGGQVAGGMASMATEVDVRSKKTEKCSSCGAKINATKPFCPECGQPTGKKEASGAFCGQCGAKLPDGVKFCPECGNKL